MSASRPAGTTPVAIFGTARGISRSDCPTGGTHRVRRAPLGARRHLRSRPADLPCGSRPPNPFPAMSAPPGALIASASAPRRAPTFPAALACPFFAAGCAAQSRGGFARPRAAEWLHPQAAWPRKPPRGPRSRAGGHALPRAAEWLHPQAGWLGGRRRLRAGRRISSDECAASGGRHWVPSPPGPSDALASPIQP